MYIGIDGCRAGWFAVCLDNKNVFKADIFVDIYTIWEKYSNAKSILIDIPIGLPGEKITNRRCDLEARKILGPKKGVSIFPAPCRQSVYARDYRDANRINKEVIGKGLPYQVWNIIPKIKELDVLITCNSKVTNVIRESHPEVCFWSMAGNSMKKSKKTADGISKRLKVLKLFCNKSEEIFDYALNEYKRKYLGKDDILDAISMAVTAGGSVGNLISIPENPQVDSKGIPMEIVYRKWPNINYHV